MTANFGDAPTHITLLVIAFGRGVVLGRFGCRSDGLEFGCLHRPDMSNLTLSSPLASYNFRTKSVKDPPRFSSSSIQSFQLMLSKFELDGELNPNFSAGMFELVISSIKVILAGFQYVESCMLELLRASLKRHPLRCG